MPRGLLGNVVLAAAGQRMTANKRANRHQPAEGIYQQIMIMAVMGFVCKCSALNTHSATGYRSTNQRL